MMTSSARVLLQLPDDGAKLVNVSKKEFTSNETDEGNCQNCITNADKSPPSSHLYYVVDFDFLVAGSSSLLSSSSELSASSSPVCFSFHVSFEASIDALAIDRLLPVVFLVPGIGKENLICKLDKGITSIEKPVPLNPC